jgi:hypothetical protein
MHPGTRDVVPLEGYRLLLTFQSGERRVFDVTPYLGVGIFTELQDPEVFRSVRVVFDSIAGSNGADLCPETLYEGSTPAIP